MGRGRVVGETKRATGKWDARVRRSEGTSSLAVEASAAPQPETASTGKMAVPAKTRHPPIIEKKKGGQNGATGGMIGESAYIEMMKNCSKWNSRIVNERRTHYPVYDAQTATAHRPFHRRHHIHAKTRESFTGSIAFPAQRWKKPKTAPPADQTEFKFFTLRNEALVDAIARSSGHVPAPAVFAMGVETPSMSAAENSNSNSRNGRLNYNEDEEMDDLMDDDFMSDDDDAWGSKKKKNKRDRSTKKKPHWSQQSRPQYPMQQPPLHSTPLARTQQPPPMMQPPSLSTPSQAPSSSNNTSPENKPFVCQYCGAKYKSRPGLNYHKAHVHADMASQQATPPAPTTPTHTPPLGASHLISPSVEVSDICDYCLGSRLENKNTSKPEQLVSCHDCGRSGHPTCLKFTENMIISTQKYGWQCIECKSCAICGTSDNDDQLLFCDDCDRGFHLYCLKPALKKPPEGEWSCHLCQRAFGPKASRPAEGVAAASSSSSATPAASKP